MASSADDYPFLSPETLRRRQSRELPLTVDPADRRSEDWPRFVREYLDGADLRMRDRAAFVLSVVVQMTDREVGAVLGISETSARNARNDAEEQIRAVFLGSSSGY